MHRVWKCNSELSFGNQGQVLDYEPYGMDLTEPKIAWTTMTTAGFSFIPDEGAARPNLKLRLAVYPFLGGDKIAAQQMFVYLNGIHLGFADIGKSEVVEFPVPRMAISPRGCQLSMVIPTSATPSSLGLSNDIRRLGVAISSAVLVSS